MKTNFGHITAQERVVSTKRSMSQRTEKISEGNRKTLEQVPNTYKPLFLKALVGDASPRQAIRAMCQRCNGYEDVIERTKNCKVLGCSLI